jgi:flagellar hook-basal body complex protein FliE
MSMVIDAANVGMRILPAEVRPSSGSQVGEAGSDTFGNTLREAVSQVEGAGLEARYKVANLIEGGGADVHDAMIAVEKADLSFQLMLQVRNKVVQAYQQIAGMQF